jgi:antitoxin component of MazEF toxin-antitoxin module
MAIETITKRWGSSIGVVIPNEAVDKLSLKPNESVVIEITRKENVLKELFGAIRMKKSTDQIIKEARAETESKWLK